MIVPVLAWAAGLTAYGLTLRTVDGRVTSEAVLQAAFWTALPMLLFLWVCHALASARAIRRVVRSRLAVGLLCAAAGVVPLIVFNLLFNLAWGQLSLGLLSPESSLFLVLFGVSGAFMGVASSAPALQ